MHRLQEVVRLHRLGNSQRAIAAKLKMGRDTIRAYLAALDTAFLLDGSPEDLPDAAALSTAVDEAQVAAPTPHQSSSAEAWRDEIVALRSRGAGPKSIHDYLKLHAEAFDCSYSSIKRFCRQLSRSEGPRPTDVAIPVVTLPGDVAQVDYCYGGKRYDPAQGVLRKTWIFIMTLGHSRLTYAEFVYSQSVESWIESHINAFEFFGGVPRVVVPDNLKAAVIKKAFSCDADDVLNRSYRELARAYGFQIDPTPIRSPQKKGKVERDAKYIEDNFLATLPDVDVPGAQCRLLRWLVEVAAKRIHGTLKKAPQAIFDQEEASELTPLPKQRWKPVIWKPVTVHRDCHVQIDGAMYSVPWRFLSQRVWARCTAKQIEIFAQDAVLCRHRRGIRGKRYTIESHLPEGRRDLRERSRAHWERRAALLGKPIALLVNRIFESDDVLLNLRRVQQIVTLLDGYPKERACRAAERALHFGSLEYGAIKKILRKGLDLQPLDGEEAPRRWSSGSRYARDPNSLPFPSNPS